MDEVKEERLLSSLEKIADCLEQTVQEPMFSFPIPSCPSCGKVNPEVTLTESGGSGPITEFVVIGKCSNCESMVYGLPLGITLLADRDEVVAALSQMKESLNGSSN